MLLAGKTDYFFIKTDNILTICRKVFDLFVEENEASLFDSVPGVSTLRADFPTTKETFDAETELLFLIGTIFIFYSNY